MAVTLEYLKVTNPERETLDQAYGTKADQTDEFFREKRPWSTIKDSILAKYIACYLKTVQSRGRPIMIVDGFSGPGKFGDGSDGSPLIALRAISDTPQRHVGMSCLFADIRQAHRTALANNIRDYISRGIAEPPLADCASALARALEVGRSHTLFFYLDPYGIKDLDFEMLRQVLARNRQQSTEILINFSFPTFMRMSGNWSYDATADEVAKKVKEAKVETVHKVMGGDYWLPLVTNSALNKFQREDEVVKAYKDRVREFFAHTVSIPVKDETAQPGVLRDDLAKYHLIFGTRSPRAVLYMNDVAYPLLEPYFDRFKDGLLFEMTPKRYERSGREVVKDALVDAVRATPRNRRDIIEATVPHFFMQHMKKEYTQMVNELVFTESRLFADPTTRRIERKLNDFTLLSTTPWPGGKGP